MLKPKYSALYDIFCCFSIPQVLHIISMLPYRLTQRPTALAADSNNNINCDHHPVNINLLKKLIILENNLFQVFRCAQRCEWRVSYPKITGQFMYY